jgi:ubiquinone/menaquinone biosynthesis C-methylase UbiE
MHTSCHPARASTRGRVGGPHLRPSASVDVVTTRSVLIYVKDRARAFAEFARVLRPGGRTSLYEPINRFVEHEFGGEPRRWLRPGRSRRHCQQAARQAERTG